MGEEEEIFENNDVEGEVLINDAEIYFDDLLL